VKDDLVWWILVGFLVLAAASRIATNYSDGHYGWAVAFGVSLGFIVGVVVTDLVQRRNR
jgi:hypothetical protein